MEDKAAAKIKYLLEQDIIEKVPKDEMPTWVSPTVIAPKPNSDHIRLCVDVRMANKAIIHPQIQLPTTDDVINKFHKATTFSKLDLREAYYQFELTPGSRKVTTFYGPDGLLRNKRFNYGTKSAQDILQNRMKEILGGIPHQINLSDDVLIGGSQSEHDHALASVLKRLDDNGVTCNWDKCLFDVPEIQFVGLTFTKEGIKPDPAKVDGLHHAGPPESKEELRSFLDMTGYSERFIPNYVQITYLLRELMRERWHWTEEHQKSFEEVKAALQKDTLLRPYQIGIETRVVVDASIKGLGAVLLQKQLNPDCYAPVYFKSKSLKPEEKNYSPTEREALAIRWALKKFRKYLLGAPQFTVISDHKPLQDMYAKISGDLPARVEKFIMDTQEFEYIVEYQPGPLNLSDYTSRHPKETTGHSRTEDVEEYAKSFVEVAMANYIDEHVAVSMANVRQDS